MSTNNTEQLESFDVLTQVVVTLPVRVKASDRDHARLVGYDYIHHLIQGGEQEPDKFQFLPELMQVDAVAEEPEGWEIYPSNKFTPGQVLYLLRDVNVYEDPNPETQIILPAGLEVHVYPEFGDGEYEKETCVNVDASPGMGGSIGGGPWEWWVSKDDVTTEKPIEKEVKND